MYFHQSEIRLSKCVYAPRGRERLFDECDEYAFEFLMPVAALRALLENAIDYAGLFPPADLALEQALKNQAAYVRSPDRWMLGVIHLADRKV